DIDVGDNRYNPTTAGTVANRRPAAASRSHKSQSSCT
ncbi:MAG: hypothetical protein JWO31_3597, partial [Phycisphaerales bacterium]|nr:hypothetical protein [Phycisphaerales bacterium]